MNRLALFTLIGFVAISPWTSAGRSAGADGDVDFGREILPLLSNKCFVCHGPDAKDPDLVRLDSFDAATSDRGGYRAIDPANLAKSQILERIESADEPMPPEDAEKQLTPAEKKLIRRWIEQGGEYSQHWSFALPRKQPPELPDGATKSDIIDAFIAAQLKSRKIPFAAPADRATLARRAALVLTGLPPEPQQLQAFLADKRPTAYSRYIDQLLASPRFGEHQARYWLDAVRYGDTHGLHLDNRRGIYPYRDWVVMAMNENLPLDKFIQWQLSGDLLPQPTKSQLVATGFVRMNPTTGEGGAIPAEFQAKNNFDRTETLGTVLLGVSMTCARCHTHKYDPITQREYYRLLAFFNSTAEPAMDGNSYTYGPTVRAPVDRQAWRKWNKLEAFRQELIGKAASLLEQDIKLSGDAAKKWRGGVADQLAVVADPAGAFAERPLQKEAAELAEMITAAEKAFTTSLVAKDLPKPRPTRFLRRGEYNLPVGDPLEPGVIEIMGPLPDGAPQNRIGLAAWLTSRRHPLVARVLINRIWQRTFGDGLVRTPEDFGLQGEQPTHPKLLDWLAVELHDSEWDLKQMLKALVMTKTFQQSSARRRDIDDPENRLFARGPSHRLDAEVLRDLALWSSGMLDPHMGGEGVKPYQPSGMWLALAHPASNTKKYVRDTGKLLYRRSLYVYWKRTSPHPMMSLFDAPDRETSCVRRSRTNTSLQSLGLLNETQRLESSRALAARLLRESPDDNRRFDQLFTMLACRKPTVSERAACQRLLAAMKKRFDASEKDAEALLAIGENPRETNLNAAEHAAWTQVAVTILASDIAIMLY
ncbi:MAG: PSD1 and planctomycete cytochrome C domain-containing protein [Pirellulaceae bacterium]|nr:PSD1 and planctomycete cytochrome C domain-containing protein [Pirellulaceae bacterium]